MATSASRRPLPGGQPLRVGVGLGRAPVGLQEQTTPLRAAPLRPSGVLPLRPPHPLLL